MPDQTPDVSLIVDGMAYAGWQQVTIRRGIEQISGTFELTYTDLWSGQDKAWPINVGGQCIVKDGADILINGYVDEVLPFFDSQQHSISAMGRDKTGDLVDCSAICKTGEWKGRTLYQVAKDICSPFGIKVIDAVGDTTQYKKSAIQEGETAFEALERAARMRGVLLVSDDDGNLVITRAGTQRIATALVQGENILSAKPTFSMRDRFKRYICKGQNTGLDTSTPDQNARPKGETEDKTVERYRPLIIIAESISDAKGLKDRALWEAAVRMGRSARVAVTVQGWRHADGLWVPNRLVYVKCPYTYLDRDMLIASVTYKIDDSGTTTEIELCRPEAFKLRAVPETDGFLAWPT